MCAMTYWYVCHDLFIHVTCFDTWEEPMGVHAMPHSYVYDIAEYRLFYRALLQKRPIILRSLLIVATPFGNVCYASFIRVTWQIHMSDVTHSHVWHDSFICETRLIHMCDTTHSHVWHEPFICVTWLDTWEEPTRIRAMTASFVWHDSLTIDICDMNDSYVCWRCEMWITSFIRVTLCDMTHSHSNALGGLHDSHVWHDSLICVTWLIHTCDVWRTFLFLYTRRLPKWWAMGWLRLVGSLKW